MVEYTRKGFAELCGTTQVIVTNNIRRGALVLNLNDKLDFSEKKNIIFYDRYTERLEKRAKEKEARIQELYDQIVHKAKDSGKKVKKKKALEEATELQAQEVANKSKAHSEKIKKALPKRTPVKRTGKRTQAQIRKDAAQEKIDAWQAERKLAKLEIEEKRKQKRKAARNGEQEDEETLDWDTRKKKAETILKERNAEKAAIELEKLAGKLLPLELVFEINRVHNQTILSTFQSDMENLASIFCDVLAGGDRKKLSEVTDKLNTHLSDVIERAKEVALSSIEQAVEEYTVVRSRGQRK